MNHSASMLSPRLKAIAARAKVPSRMATIHPMKEIGLGKRCVIVVAIATKLPRAALQCGVSYRRKGRVVYSAGVSGWREMRAAPAPKVRAMSEPLLVAKAGATELALLPALANRHGLITGATGTGKTVSLQKLAEQLSRIGAP